MLKTERTTFKQTKPEKQKLLDYARQADEKISDIIRTALSEYYERRGL